MKYEEMLIDGKINLADKNITDSVNKIVSEYFNETVYFDLVFTVETVTAYQQYKDNIYFKIRGKCGHYRYLNGKELNSIFFNYKLKEELKINNNNKEKRVKI